MQLIELTIYTTDPTHTAEWAQEVLFNAAKGKGIAFHCAMTEDADNPCPECKAYALGHPDGLFGSDDPGLPHILAEDIAP